MTWIKAQREIHLSLMMMMMKREEEETSSSFSLSSYNLQRYKLVEIERQVKRLWNIENRTVWIFSSSQMSLMDDVRERESQGRRGMHFTWFHSTNFWLSRINPSMTETNWVHYLSFQKTDLHQTEKEKILSLYGECGERRWIDSVFPPPAFQLY